MPANLIKLVSNGTITEFIPSRVDIIQLQPGSSTIQIVLASGKQIDFNTPSPNDALNKLALLETAMNSGTGIATITNSNSATTTTTTAAPSGPAGPASPGGSS